MRSELIGKVAAADPACKLAVSLQDDEWRLMAEAIMVSDAPAPAADASEAVIAEHLPRAGHGRTTPRRVRRTVAVLAAACALVALPVGVSLTGRQAGASAEAAGVLDTAALHASDPAAAGDQYWRITTVGGSTDTRYETRDGTEVRSTWWIVNRTVRYVAVDGARPTYTEWTPGVSQRQLTGGPGWSPTPRDVTIQTTNLTPNDLPGGWQTPNPAFLASLPRDVNALRERLYADVEGHGRSPDGEVLVYVADLLRSGLVPADLRAALFRVVKSVPGVDVTSRAVTLQGRRGIGLARTEPLNGTRQEIVFDPGTGLLIGEREIAVEGTSMIPAGTVLSETSVRTDLVDDVPAAITNAAEHASCTVDTDNGVTCSKTP